MNGEDVVIDDEIENGAPEQPEADPELPPVLNEPELPGIPTAPADTQTGGVIAVIDKNAFYDWFKTVFGAGATLFKVKSLNIDDMGAGGYEGKFARATSDGIYDDLSKYEWFRNLTCNPNMFNRNQAIVGLVTLKTLQVTQEKGLLGRAISRVFGGFSIKSITGKIKGWFKLKGSQSLEQAVAAKQP